MIYEGGGGGGSEINNPWSRGGGGHIFLGIWGSELVFISDLEKKRLSIS